LGGSASVASSCWGVTAALVTIDVPLPFAFILGGIFAFFFWKHG
jgi:hypothetical protein